MARPVLATLEAARRHRSTYAAPRATVSSPAKMPDGPVQFVLRPVVSNDGQVYRSNQKLIHILERDGNPSAHTVGGVIILRDKALAFVSGMASALLDGSIGGVIQSAESYAWGADVTEAVLKIRPNLPGVEPGPSQEASPDGRKKIALNDFGPMIALFDNSRNKAGRTPKIRLLCEETTLELSVAGPTASRPGTINVVSKTGETDGRWFGRVLRTGEFEVSPRTELPDPVLKTLRDFSSDPLGSMVAFGRKLGICAVCARTLSDPQSIKLGIGPICMARLNFEVRA